MTAGLGRGIALTATGVLVGLAIVAALFGSGDLLRRVRGDATPGEPSRSIADLPPGGNANSDKSLAKSDKPRPNAGDRAAIDPDKNPLAGPDRSQQAETRQGGAMTPSLDILRVEPSGDTVLAGRGAPKAAIELLRDNQTVARVTADETGQFAIDSLALPPGNSELTLRSISPDGSTTEGKASAVIVVDKDKRAQPLVAVSEPDKPTRVLSMPGPTAEAGKDTGKPSAVGEKSDTSTPRREAALPGAPAVGSTAVKIVSVDAQEGGRLFVSGQGAAWTSLRLYLNDTLVASGRSGADGRIGFTIGRGVKPGGYQIRIDQVDAESGKVGNRAQVGFTFPVQLAAKEPVKTASKDAPVAPAKPEALAAPLAEKPAALLPSVTEPTASETPAVAAGAARPKAVMSSPDAEKRTAEPLSSTLPGAQKLPGIDARTASPASPVPAGGGRSLPANRPSVPQHLAESPASTAKSPDMAASAEPGTAPGDQAATVFVPEISTAKIIRGDSLWQISRKTYGNGKRYTVIYDANQEQIRNPDLIFPGQIFVLPKDAPGADGQGAKRG